MNKETELLICGYNKNTKAVIISSITMIDKKIESGRCITVLCVFFDTKIFCSKNLTNRFKTKAMPKPIKSGLMLFSKEERNERIGEMWKSVKMISTIRVESSKI